MQPMTPEMIDNQLVALDAAMADLEGRAANLALAATEGDAEAVATLAGVRAEMELCRGDRFILVQARRASEARAATQGDAIKAAERAAHLTDAKAAAGRLRAAATRIDALVRDFQSSVDDLVAAQSAVRFSFRSAGEPLHDARVGRSMAETHAAFLMGRAVDGSAKTRADKSMQVLIETAWAELLDTNGKGVADV